MTLVELDDGSYVASRVRQGGAAALAGMTRGAIVTAWEGQAVGDALAGADIRWEGQPPATCSGRRLAQLRRLVRAPVGAAVAVEFSNPGVPAATRILTAIDDTLATWNQTRFTIFGTDGFPLFTPADLFDPLRYEILPSGYGYIRSAILVEVDGNGNISGTYDNTVAELLQAIDAFNAAQVRGIIVDVRDNPGGFDDLAAIFGSMFYDHTEVYEHASFYDDDAGSFVVLPSFTLQLEPQASYFGGPVVCLVNAGTASSAEGIAMAIQLDSDSALAGGVEPDRLVPLDPTAVEAWIGEGVDIALAYAEFLLDQTPSVVSPPGTPGARARLLGGYPNPFNPNTTIRFVAPVAGLTTLSIRDVRGRLVRTLFERTASAGLNEVCWDGHDEQGQLVSTGTYLCELVFGNQHATAKLTLMK